MHRLLVIGATSLLALALSGAASAWSWPADGEVLRPFTLGGDAYAAGQHRGIDVAGPEGSAVRAPASGTVSFAGSLPTYGRGVTILTGDGYAVTLVHLGSIGVAKGDTVAEGSPVGTMGSSGDPEHTAPSVHLGIRVAAEPEGYVDPLGLLPPRPEPVATPPPAPAPAPVVVSGPTPAPAPGRLRPGSGRCHSQRAGAGAATVDPQPCRDIARGRGRNGGRTSLVWGSRCLSVDPAPTQPATEASSTGIGSGSEPASPAQQSQVRAAVIPESEPLPARATRTPSGMVVQREVAPQVARHAVGGAPSLHAESGRDVSRASASSRPPLAAAAHDAAGSRPRAEVRARSAVGAGEGSVDRSPSRPHAIEASAQDPTAGIPDPRGRGVMQAATGLDRHAAPHRAQQARPSVPLRDSPTRCVGPPGRASRWSWRRSRWRACSR